MKRTTVKVWNERIEITTHQKSQSVWIARGEYMGQPLVAEGRSESSAVKHWQDAAKYKGNG